MQGKSPVATWHARAAALKINGDAFIDGRYQPAVLGERFDCLSPIDGRLLARVAACDTADADLAVTAARRAFEQRVWAGQTPGERKRVLQRFADLLLEHRDELALLETLDMGKPIADSMTVDIPATARCIAWYAEAIDKVYDEVAPTGEDALALITRQPVGVVAAIVPWNFPLIMAAWKIGPALAAGNSLILKPSEKSPLSAIRIAELASAAGIPDGVFNVLPGYGHTVGKALALHMDVDCVAFTGSTRTGKLMLQYSGQSNMKRVWLECGGKSPNIILADCPDLDRAAASAASAIFFNQGEMCSAGSRLIVEAGVRDAVLEKILAAARGFEPGDPLDPATRLGAIVDETQLNTVLRYIESGRSEGGQVLTGGRQALTESKGYYVEPTVFGDVRPEMRIAREEIFGPVLAAMTVADAEEAVRVGNSVIYGLAAAVWTRDITRAHRMARALRSGLVYVNCYDADDITVPFGGVKQSGTGRDKSLHAFDKYTELKTTWIDLST
jgi:acyl-CoA reductase-like NAD-dependent aldehyde dehydrogenase